jgi:capreomycidine synthase
MHQLAAAPLEDWLRDYYFSADIDIGGSGVQDFSLSELRSLTGLRSKDLDNLVLQDSRTLGSPGLRQAIARRWAGGDVDRVMATTGSSEAIFVLMGALLRPGDEVIVLDPGYHSLVQLAAAIGCKLKRWMLRFEDAYRPNFDELGALLTSQTRMIVVNFPHNPTGSSLTPEEQSLLVAMAERVSAYLLWDLALSDLVYDQPALPNVTELYDRAIGVNTLSKAYGLPGLRVGWCVAPTDVLMKCIVWRDYTTLFLSPLIELLAQRALEHEGKLRSLRLEQARTNLDILSGWMAVQEQWFEWVKPWGGVTAFPRLRHVSDTTHFCHSVLQETGTLLVPGSCFHQPQHIRIGFGGQTDQLRTGLARLAEFLLCYRFEE